LFRPDPPISRLCHFDQWQFDYSGAKVSLRPSPFGHIRLAWSIVEWLKREMVWCGQKDGRLTREVNRTAARHSRSKPIKANPG